MNEHKRLSSALIALLERQRSAEQLLYILGPQAHQTIDEFTRFQQQRDELLQRLAVLDEA